MSRKFKKKEYVQLWQTKLENSKKLEFYKTFKSDYNCEQYLNIINNPIQRRDYTKLRISNHNLMIEYGRYGNAKTPRENRRCPVCNLNHVETERHLIFTCSCYELRERFYDDIKYITKIEFPPKDQETQFITKIMKSKNSSVIHIFSKIHIGLFSFTRV